MSEASRIREHKIETYARTLLEAAKAEGREKADLRLMEHLRKMNPEVASLLLVILSKGDWKLLPEIARRYAEIFNDETDVVAVDVTTAVQLNDTTRKETEEALKRVYNKEIYLVEHVDPEIMGGIIYSARGIRVDASVKTQLETARQELKTGSESEDLDA